MKKKLLLSLLVFSLVFGGFTGLSIEKAEAISITNVGTLSADAQTLLNRINAVLASVPDSPVTNFKDEVAAKSDLELEAIADGLITPMGLSNTNSIAIKAEIVNLFNDFETAVLDFANKRAIIENIFQILATQTGENRPSISDITTFISQVETAVVSAMDGSTSYTYLIANKETIKASAITNVEVLINARGTDTAKVIDSLGLTATHLSDMIQVIETAFPTAVDLKLVLAAAYLAYITPAPTPDPTPDPVIVPPTTETVEEVLTDVTQQLENIESNLSANTNSAVAGQQAKQAVEDAIKKISNLDFKGTVTVTNGVAKPSFNQAELATQFNKIKENAQKANDKLKEINPNVKPAKVVATLSLGNINQNNVEVPVSKDTIDQAKAAGIQALAVEVDGVTLEFDLAELNEDTTLTVNKEAKTVATNVTDKPIASQVYNFEFTSNNDDITTFKKPVELKLPIVDTSDYDTDLLTLAKIINNRLEYYGGIYDSSTKTFNAKRNSFSSYTVVENKVTFNDTASVKAWAGRQIDVVAAKGIIEGRGEGNFDPTANITRAEFAKLIVKSFSLENTDAAENFADVNDSDWFKPYVAAAVEAGIINGRNLTEFDPHANITRAEMATMASRGLVSALDYEQITDVDAALAAFSDAGEINATLRAGVALSAAHGVVIGAGDNQFKPNGNATRAEAAVLIYRLINK